ncbi:teichoic acid D-Ala incorporation-associated protein DltX [Streptococcus hongkongensis]|nr:D-alanyl-lipoteichoic acid biosynthesis protein [Streptococcus uberis]
MDKGSGKKKDYLYFFGKVLLFYMIFMLLVYFFAYAGHGQGSFIYNEF